MQRATQPESRASERVIERAEFGELYLRYRDPVFRYVRRLSGSEDEAADLTALTFEHALAKLHGYRGEGAGFAPRLLRIARNLAWDARRRKRPWLPLQLLDAARHPREPSAPEEATLRRESVGEVSRHNRGGGRRSSASVCCFGMAQGSRRAKSARSSASQTRRRRSSSRGRSPS